MQWQPHITVATVVQRDNQFLLVEEWSEGERVFNQPAGHLEPGESLEQAAIRETLEETGWEVELQGVVNLALYKSPINGVTYHRTTFFAAPRQHHPERPLDDGIERAVWLSAPEIEAAAERLRSPLVLDAVARYQAGERYPLSMLQTLI